jgi:hypothetical protein
VWLFHQPNPSVKRDWLTASPLLQTLELKRVFMETQQQEKINFSFYMHFAFRILALGTLISIIPLVFINLPMMAALLGLPSFFHVLIILSLNITTFIACFALASKLILSWGVKGHAFNVTKH